MTGAVTGPWLDDPGLPRALRCRVDGRLGLHHGCMDNLSGPRAGLTDNLLLHRLPLGWRIQPDDQVQFRHRDADRAHVQAEDREKVSATAVHPLPKRKKYLLPKYSLVRIALTADLPFEVGEIHGRQDRPPNLDPAAGRPRVLKTQKRTPGVAHRPESPRWAPLNERGRRHPPYLSPMLRR